MHRWSDEDDRLLVETVNGLATKLPKRTMFWHAASGALAMHGLVVTPDAARTRCDRLRAAAEEQAAQTAALQEVERTVLGAETAEQAEDAWERVERLVEEHERGQLDHLVDAVRALGLEVSEIRGDLAVIRSVVSRLLREWEG